MAFFLFYGGKDMQIIEIDINDIKQYKNNAKIHTKKQIEQIVKSIERYGNNDPIAIDENNTIIEGHGRYLALKKLGYTEVPVIRLEHLTEEQKREYILVHNKLTMNTDFDLETLKSELDFINFDMTEFDFDIFENIPDEFAEENPYTSKITTPTYEPTKEQAPEITELYNMDKAKRLIEKIERSDLKPEIKEFLKIASYRHVVFDYRNIAEFYSHADKDTQELFEDNLLVIIDYNKAIENGVINITADIAELADE